MPSPEDRSTPENEIVERLAYLIRRSSDADPRAAEARAREILAALTAPSTPANIARALRRSGARSRPRLEAGDETRILSGICRLSPTDAEVLELLLAGRKQASA